MNLLPARAESTLVDRVHHVDLFTLCDWVYEAGIKVDMILCDLPYGTTDCAWDAIIPLEPMWMRFRRIIKRDGVIVLTSAQPFTTTLIASNMRMFRYCWYWVKSYSVGFMNANKMPLRNVEEACVFYNELPLYNPQGVRQINRSAKRNRDKSTTVYSRMGLKDGLYTQQFENYPTQVLEFGKVSDTIHPTQKPVALFEYLIRTYTKAGELVLDPCVGSGTTAEAARNTQRRYIVGDAHWKYAALARKRMEAPYTLPMFAADAA